MANKNEVLDLFVEWKKRLELQIGRKIKMLRSDNGGEYTSDPFLQLCRDEDIERCFTISHTPQQNGVAGRLNRSLLEKIRCLLSQSGLEKIFWAEALTYASHLINRLPSSAIEGKTPMEMWSGKPAHDYDQLKVFGCPAYYHVRTDKLEPRARKAIFVGFKRGVKGYKLWDPVDKKIVLSRDVTFDEASILKLPSSHQVESDPTEEISQVVEIDAAPHCPDGTVSMQVPTEVTPGEHDGDTEDTSTNVQDQEPTAQVQDSIAARRQRRNIQMPARYANTVAYALPVESIDELVPTTFREAEQSSEADSWQVAMQEEMESLHKNDTWELVELPKGRKAIGCKCVYTKKEGIEGTPLRFKSRLVAKGYAQEEGIDYNEVFSPVVKHSSIRILLALVAQYGLELDQLDVKTTFLHGDLDKKIYTTQPLGFQAAGKDKLVCRLKK